MIGSPRTYSIAKYGRPSGVVPASNTLAIAGCSISASAWRSASKRAITCAVSMPGLMSLMCDLALHWLELLRQPNFAHPAFA